MYSRISFPEGFSRLHLSLASGQRLLNGHRLGPGRRSRPSPQCTARPDHDIACPERTAQVVGIGGGGDQELGVRVGGMLGDILGRPALDDLAAVHHQYLVREVTGGRDVVRDVEQRQGEPGAQIVEKIEHLQPDGDVEHGHRLVGQQHRRLGGEGPGEGDPLPLAAGQLVRVPRHRRLC